MMLVRQRIWCSLNSGREISSTPHLHKSWMDWIKGEKAPPNPEETPSIASFTLLRFAEELGKARKLGSFKQYVVGRSSEATFADSFQKQEAILRYLGGFDPSGEKIKSTEKQETAKKCNCTILEVETALAKFTWAKEAQKKMDKLKEEGKPLPSSMAEVQKLMGNTPIEVAQANLAKSGSISRNAFCPCGSKKRYKKCCGKD